MNILKQLCFEFGGARNVLSCDLILELALQLLFYTMGNFKYYSQCASQTHAMLVPGLTQNFDNS